jgi:hypothetical protein
MSLANSGRWSEEGYKLQVTGYELQLTSYELRVASCGLRVRSWSSLTQSGEQNNRDPRRDLSSKAVRTRNLQPATRNL